MAKHKLKSSRRPKEATGSRSPRLTSSLAKILSNEDDSVATLPLEIKVPPIGKDKDDGSYNRPQPVMEEERSTLSNEESSVHFLELLSEDVGDDVMYYSRSPKAVRHQRDSPKGNTDNESLSLSYMKARQNSLLDDHSSLVDSTATSVQQDFSMSSNQSNQVRRIASQTSRVSLASRPSRASSSKGRYDYPDEESSWGDMPSRASSRRSPVRQTASSNCRQLPVVHQNHSLSGTNKKHVQTVSWNKGHQNEDFQPGQEEENDYDVEQEQEWNESFVSSHTDSRLGPSWSTEPSNTQSTVASDTSATTSVALVRKKWRAKRRLFKRNAKWNAEQDWFSENENEDWPGDARHHRALPIAIVEEEEGEENEIEKEVEEDTSLSSEPPSSKPKRSFVSRFFACSS